MTLDELVARSMSVSVEFNPHRNFYESVEEYFLAVQRELQSDWSRLSQRTRDALLKGDRLVALRVYPRTPVGFDLFYGATLDQVLALAEKRYGGADGRQQDSKPREDGSIPSASASDETKG